MAAPMRDVAGKLDKKLTKKILKIKDHLATKHNVVVCEHPTTIVCVQNGGLDNGVSQNDLHGLFELYGEVKDIIMIPRKPFCFVCYATTENAATAKQQLTGHLLREGKDPSQNVTLYLFFVASAPSSVCPSRELPPGLLLLEDFISRETEQQLLDCINFEVQGPSNTGGSLKHRQVKHFGYEFKYGVNNVDPNEPLAEGIPEQCRQFLQQAVDMKVVSHFPDQLTVNRYLAGQGIPPHVDTPSAFEDGIMSVSCGSQVIMDFRHPDGRHLSVLVPPRSLLVMSGESGKAWSHGITPRKSDIVSAPSGGITLAARGTRVSFTFRKLSPTAGILSEEKDSLASCLPQTEEEAVALENQHVHQVYEEIADHFSDTRHKPWPQIAQFLMEQEPGSILVDVGCGNGKYFGVNPQLCQIGSDRSMNLASIVQSRGFEVFVGDVLAIPLRSSSVDVGLCIAVIHHLSTQVRRRQAIEELVRILRPGGSVLIYVWAQEQQKDNQKSTYLKPYRQYKKELQTETQCMDTLPCSTAEPSAADGECASRTGVSCADQSENNAEKSDTDGWDQMKASCLSDKGNLPTSCLGDKGNLPPSCLGDKGNLPPSCLGDKGNLPTSCRGDKDNLPIKHCETCCGLKQDRNDTEQNDDTHSRDLRQQGSETSQTNPNTQVLKVHVNRTEFKEQDMLVPWLLKKPRSRDAVCGHGEGREQTFQRFYHVFQQGELDALCSQVVGCVINRSYYDQGNWCVVLQKS